MKNIRIPILFLIQLIFISYSSFAQDNVASRPSPPVVVQDKIDETLIAIHYSAPSVKGRAIWGELVPYDRVWRTGANEATVFESDEELILNGEKLPAGKYGLFTIPGATEWVFIFNSVWDQWGAYKYDATKDVIRIKATPQGSPVFHEKLAFEINGHHILLHWENLTVGLEVSH